VMILMTFLEKYRVLVLCPLAILSNSRLLKSVMFVFDLPYFTTATYQ
jgi:hypothetical protein